MYDLQEITCLLLRFTRLDHYTTIPFQFYRSITEYIFSHLGSGEGWVLEIFSIGKSQG